MPHTSRFPRIYYRVERPGPSTEPPVVFIQGLGLSSRFWFDAPANVRAATGRTTVILDNRGTGQSDRVRRPFRIGSMADDVIAVLDDAGIAEAVIVGISLGGMVAQEVALRHPSRTAGLVLLATTPGLPLGRLPPLDSLATLLSLPFAGTKGGPRLNALLLSARDMPHAATLFARWPEALSVDPVTPATFLVQFLAAGLHSTGGRLHQIRCPTVVVTGAEDRLILPVNSERLAAKIAGSVLEVLADVSHAVPTSDPHSITRALASLAKASGPRSVTAVG